MLRSDPKPVLVEEEVPRPEPRPGEVIVRVHAVAVTPTELLWYPTWHTKEGAARNDRVLGHEFSGEVAACGEGVSELSAGQEVYGMNDWFAEGALAEFCATTPELIASKPRRLSHPEAATVPISALTAWQGLFDRGLLQAGERVLVHGGTGAVGLFAVQLAHMHGAHVIATVSAANIDLARSLGADEALDYRGTPFEECVSDVDLVFDTVGNDTLRRSWQVLKPGGRMVTVAVDSKSDSDERVRESFFIVEPNRMQLAEISRLLETGELRTAVDRTIPVSAAADAYAETHAKQGPGKLVVSTSPWNGNQR